MQLKSKLYYIYKTAYVITISLFISNGECITPHVGKEPMSLRVTLAMSLVICSVAGHLKAAGKWQLSPQQLLFVTVDPDVCSRPRTSQTPSFPITPFSCCPAMFPIKIYTYRHTYICIRIPDCGPLSN